MNTHRETILKSVVSRITAAAGAGVYRSRAIAFARRELPAIVVRPGGEQNEQIGTDRVKRTFQILVEVHSKSDSNPNAEVAADEAADPLIAGIHAALFDREMQEPQFTDADETRVGITLVYEAVYMTRSQDISKPTNH